MSIDKDNIRFAIMIAWVIFFSLCGTLSISMRDDLASGFELVLWLGVFLPLPIHIFWYHKIKYALGQKGVSWLWSENE